MFMDKTLRSRVRELMEATSSRERLEGELSAATEIQMGFLPKPLAPGRGRRAVLTGGEPHPGPGSGRRLV